MNREKLVAFGLIALTFSTAIGNWIVGAKSAPAPVETVSDEGQDNFSFSKITKLAGDNADIAVIDVYGPIMYGNESLWADTPSGITVLQAVRRAAKDNVKAILLRLNTPGGTASASQAIYDELQKVKRDHGIKVVAAMGDVAASGGYYIAAAADRIVANPSTLTGSIGVIMNYNNLQGLFGKIGVTNITLKSGRYKDMGSPFRSLPPEERALLQSIIDDTYQQFIEAVAKGRQLPLAKVKQLADGRIYTGRQAYDVKLVDQMGNLHDAMATTLKLVNLDESAKFKNYTKPDWQNQLFGSLSESRLPGSLQEAIARLESRDPQLAEMNKIPLMLYQ